MAKSKELGSVVLSVSNVDFHLENEIETDAIALAVKTTMKTNLIHEPKKVSLRRRKRRRPRSNKKRKDMRRTVIMMTRRIIMTR